jgi:hypothetical protein
LLTFRLVTKMAGKLYMQLSKQNLHMGVRWVHCISRSDPKSNGSSTFWEIQNQIGSLFNPATSYII